MWKGRLRLRQAVIASVLLFVVSPQAGVQEYTFEELAALGEPYPDGPPGSAYYYDFEPYAINNLGEIAYGADLCHLNEATMECEALGEGVFFRNAEGETQLLARAEDPARDCRTEFGEYFRGLISLNDLGDVAFCFTLVGDDYSGGLFVFSKETGQVRGVVCPGDPAPGGGTIKGTTFHPRINNRGDAVFPAHITGADIDPNTPPGLDGIGQGILLRRANGQISSVVRPGDLAPGGGVFDFAVNPWINDFGDVAFGAHVAGELCDPPGGDALACQESIYLKKASGEIISIAHQEEPAPGGGNYRLAFGPILNNQGEVVFIGDLTPLPAAFGKDLGVFLYTGEETIPIARPGDAMPGGGTVTTASFFVGGCDLNDCGEVCFNASLETDEGPAQGLYVWSGGEIRLVARTGTVLRDKDGNAIGTITALLPPDDLPFFPHDFPYTHVGTAINELGQIAFTAVLTDGRGVLLRADPPPPPATPIKVVPPHVEIAGKTLSEWALAWWEWAWSIPAECDPASDPDGRYCDRAQSGPVWFLAGTRGAQAQRSCTVPPGKHLFFPILNTIAGADTCAEARSLTVPVVEGMTDMQCRLDGVPVSGIECHREILCCDDICLPDCNRFQAPATPFPVGPMCVDGYWLMLEPPEPGPHVIEFSGRIVFPPPDAPFNLDVRYDLTVGKIPTDSWFRRGDVNDDGPVNLTDAIALLEFLFLGGEPPSCFDAADTDDTGTLLITDAIYLLSWLFLGGCPPPAPGPHDCGPDNRRDCPDAACGNDAFADCLYESCSE